MTCRAIGPSKENSAPDNPAGVGGGALPGGIGWYRKTFTVPESDSSKLTFIRFDGVYKNSEVWINGHYLGKRPYGYSSFQYELTPFINFGGGKNVLAVESIILAAELTLVFRIGNLQERLAGNYRKSFRG